MCLFHVLESLHSYLRALSSYASLEFTKSRPKLIVIVIPTSMPIYRSESDLHILVSTTAECSDELDKSKRSYVQKFVELASRPRDMLSSGWLPKMGRSYGSGLMVVLGLGYWVQGFRIFPWWALNFYFKDNLRLDPATMQFLQNNVNLPMVAKPIYGIFSDAVYIGGAHRLPYICIGGRCNLLLHFLYSFFQ